MPLYEYKCNKCDKIFEVKLGADDKRPETCIDACGGHLNRIWDNQDSTFILKGRGWTGNGLTRKRSP